jgi:hypothetical protein
VVNFGGRKMINLDVLRDINYIIENDSTSSTYKYALLKAVINSCQKYDHLIKFDGNDVHVPLGLIIEDWIIDYMPFVYKQISQQNNKRVLSNDIEIIYHEIFKELQLNPPHDLDFAYKQFIFSMQYSMNQVKLKNLYFKLSKKIATTIVNMPMKYIGKSHYGIFKPNSMKFGSVKLTKNQIFDKSFLINNFDYFTLSKDYYYIFRYLGQTLYGSSTIMSKWKEKTLVLNKDQETINEIDKILTNIIDERDTSKSRQVFSGKQICVWTGKTIEENKMDIDHILPYSVWENNDFWNLLPSDRNLNQKQKKDKIPTSKLIEKQADIIINYWKIYEKELPVIFQSQIKSSLVNENELHYEKAINSLCQKSDYLIHDRGYIAFEI